MAIRKEIRNQMLGVTATGLLALTMAGCGAGTIVTGSTASVSATGISGIAHGGAIPISNASVQLYATTSGGYGAAANLIGTATTGQFGQFSITPVAGTTCPATQQAYVTVSGGNTSGNYAGGNNNASYLFMAALGPCNTVSSTTNIYINEVTTVAAAYSLRSFMSLNGTIVNVGAPANNNAAAGTCTGSGATLACTAAGLPHAFANALNLANSITNGGPATGNAYQVAPSNTNSSVPTALINSLANSIQACVNSNGGASGDSSPCGNLFLYTTPPTAGATAPTNTLQALMNTAQYPTLISAGGTNNTGNLFALATAQNQFYNPTLTAAPTDYSLAVSYTGVTIASQSGAVTSVTLTNTNTSGFGSGDAYTAVPTVTFSAPTAGTTATGTASLGLVFFNVTGGVCTPTTAGGTTTTVTIAGGGGTGAAATATIGTGGVLTGGTVTASGYGYTSLPTFTVANCTTQPTAAQKVKGLGVVAVAITNGGSGYTAAPTVTFGAPPTSTSPASATATGTANLGGATPFNAPYVLALDANDNVYVGSQNATGTAGAYSYLSGMSANGTSVFTTPQSTVYTSPRGIATDTLSNIWVAQNNTTAIQGFTNTGGAASTSVLTTGAAPFGLAVDRANNIWYGIASVTAQNLFEFVQATTYSAAAFTTPPVFTNAIRTIAFDPYQNAYVSGFNTTANTTGVFPNAGTVAAPAYGTAAAPVINTTLTGTGGAGLALDSAANAWTPTVSTTGTLNEATPTPAGTGTVTALTAAAALNDNVLTPNYDAVDGSGGVWVTNNSAATQAITQYIPSLSLFNSFQPCYAAAGATACNATSLSQPQRVQVDSTGSVWITSLNNGRIYQLLGTGIPTWPQLSYSNPGTQPH